MTEDSFHGDLSRDESFLLNASLPGLTSTPKKTVRPRPLKHTSVSPFKKPHLKAPKPVIAICKICKREYRSMRYYKTHVQGHALKEASSRVPNTEELLSHAMAVAQKTLQVMRSKGYVGLHAAPLLEVLTILEDNESAHWKDFVNSVCGEFSKVLCKVEFCMPSSLNSISLKIAEELLSSRDKREVWVKSLQNILHCDVQVINLCICDFILKFVDQVVIFIARSLRNAKDDKDESTRAISFDEEERKTIYYVGGSIANGYRQMARRFPKSEKWQAISDVIVSKFLTTEGYESFTEQVKKDSKWTLSRSRGGLNFITGETQEFLLSVCKIIAMHEKKEDGSLPIDLILEKVVQGPPRLQWDIVVGQSLTEELSFSLMTGVTRSLIKVQGPAIVQRRIREIFEDAAIVSQTLRQKVAPR